MHARERAQLVSGNATWQLRNNDGVQPCTRCLVAHAPSPCTPLLLLRKAVWWHAHHQQRLHLPCGAADRRGHVWPGAGRAEGWSRRKEVGMTGMRRGLKSTYSQARAGAGQEQEWDEMAGGAGNCCRSSALRGSPAKQVQPGKPGSTARMRLAGAGRAGAQAQGA